MSGNSGENINKHVTTFTSITGRFRNSSFAERSSRPNNFGFMPQPNRQTSKSKIEKLKTTTTGIKM
jgi:hypothetical protein